MSKLIYTILLISIILTPTILQADSYSKPLNTSKEGYQVLANQISASYAVKATTVKKIISCESNWNPSAINHTKREYSVGLAQLNLKAHPEISIDEAKDPRFAITYLAKNLAKGKGHQWTCFK